MVKFVPPNPVPGVPLNLGVVIINSSAVIVSWSSPSMVNGIILNYELCCNKKDEMQQKVIICIAD